MTAAATAPVLDYASRTDPGLRREVNEDAVLAQDPCFLVADGMGGHEAGDRASRAAIDVFVELLAAGAGPLGLGEVETAIENARYAVADIARHSARGAGCTLTGVVRVEHEGEPFWYVLNVGDSRVYLHRGTELTQLTADHSLREELLARGITDADTTPRNVITRALGSEDPRHDAWLLPIQTGARLLICSDGLTTELSDAELLAVLTVGGRPASVADELLRRACESGGRDNISLIVVDTVSGGSGEGAGARPWETGTVGPTGADDDTLERTLPGRHR
ncbi:serine/threonine-protein phosphatase [Leucobacter sp. CSA1]|uniref:Serine/threonine-protein phosphatase n=1 Tax=Leucobacter chromiisoli TaxID=2796471 RepID=A0A934UU51_9MICO|nr:protein phosphatase 2C domain-containing protein [Leucobacter chromiisoli]MBK0417602.1 serine/threonine-protein phosphatase [Leucobacter chromiisoli]